MPQQQSDTAAQVAFQSDIARALARRTGDMPLHSRVTGNEQTEAEAASPATRHEEKEPRQ